MILEVNGVAYSDFTSISVNRRLDALCAQFSFEAVRIGNTPLPFKGGEACRILDEGDLILTGNIERLDVNYAVGSHNITLSGRDKTGDIVDSSLRAVGDFNPPITLKRCIQLAIRDIGASLSVIDRSGVESFQSAADMVAPEPGQGAFEFIEKLSRKRQVLLTSDGAANVVITRAASTRSTGALQNILGAADNNIVSGSISYDGTGRFRDYTFASSLNPIALIKAGVTDLVDIASQSGDVTDATIRRGRQLVLQSESSLSSGNNRERALWEADLRKARGRLYSVTVHGFRTGDGDLWAVNTVVPVVDDFAGINGDMLINEVTFNYSVDQGSTTAITLVPPNAYTLELAEPQAQVLGDGLVE